ncbi:hypothetical protein [Brevundimonas sp.]|uniref:hypothetical protein n=1 Tax=Brevundimonas sp. TaxID=1871086 RepID=UPI002E164390|nr:hypothetical protein [Brevundimonas sp.]
MTIADEVSAKLQRLAILAEQLGHDDLIVIFTALKSEVEADPPLGARRVLSQFDVGIDKVFTPANGRHYLPAGPLRDAAFESAAEQAQLYEAALALWHATKPPSDSVDLDALRRSGVDIVLRDGRYFTRYDDGGHASVERVDEISLKQAQQAELGPMHYDSVLRALAQARDDRFRTTEHASLRNRLPAPLYWMAMLFVALTGLFAGPALVAVASAVWAAFQPKTHISGWDVVAVLGLIGGLWLIAVVALAIRQRSFVRWLFVVVSLGLAAAPVIISILVPGEISSGILSPEAAQAWKNFRP